MSGMRGRSGLGLWALFCALGVFAQVPVAVPHQPANRTYAQIVRLREVQGDVRVLRVGGAEWEEAEANLPLESGFMLATGTGRAEIEFEDASTAWLGEDSALKLEDLHTSSGAPSSQVSLLAGTLSLHAVPSPGGAFVVTTPTDALRAKYPENLYLRVNAFLDAMAVTPLKTETLHVDGAAAAQTGRGTVFYAHGEVVAPERTGEKAGYAAWDQWVANRVALQAAAVKSVQAASGLKGTIPGMADLYGQGTFFACKPYGMCWEPPADAAPPAPPDEGHMVPVRLEAEGPGSRPLQLDEVRRVNDGSGPGEPYFVLSLSPTSATAAPGGRVAATVSVIGLSGFADLVDISVAAMPPQISCVGVCGGQAKAGQSVAMQFAVDAGAVPGDYVVEIAGVSGGVRLTTQLTIHVPAQNFEMPVVFGDNAPAFPCTPDGVQVRTRIDPRTGRVVAIKVGPRYATPYAWAVCHAGAWIYLHNVYVWVPTLRRHHHCPVRWVKCRKKEGWVPKHPLDVKAELPRNAKHEVYCPDKKDGRVERVRFDPKDGIVALAEAPEEFRRPVEPVLVRTGAPRIPAYDWRARPLPGRPVVDTAVLSFGGKTNKVMVERVAAVGTMPVREPLGTRRPAAVARAVPSRSGPAARPAAATHTGAASHPAPTHAAAPARAASAPAHSSTPTTHHK